MRIALGQINPIVGDISGNLKLALDALRIARESAADMVLFPEMALLGYPPRDLLFRDGVVEACEKAVAELARAAGDMLVVIGHPRRHGAPGRAKDACNSASLLRAGSIIATYDKQLLPGYDVFDEDRWFEPGVQSCIVEHSGRRIGVLICEDIWRALDVEGGAHLASRFADDPVARALKGGAEILCVLSASPFVVGKGARHVEQVRAIAKKHRVTVALCNQVGANDDLVFDGRSFVVQPDGTLAARLPSFSEAVETIDLERTSAPASAMRDDHPTAEIFAALRLGIQDYVRKTGHDDVWIGLSGGIDSAVTAALAVAALGPARVAGVLMPSRHTSRASIDDATALARNLAIERLETIPIENAHRALAESLQSALREAARGIVDENVQARIRGVLLMAMSNARPRSLVLATGNKSELAMGYTTLYGDMCGALSPLGDLLKTQVYELARWINANAASCGLAKPPIPQSSIDKAPTAELRPNQTDQDALPPYAILDEIIRRSVDHEEDVETIIRATGFDDSLVRRTARQIDQSEYKRKQAAIILKVSPRAFGPGRPMPAAMRSA
jgi:NAD+ synthetase